jgi:malate dehydrogenase (oxaloacetate-decarboxylating)
MANPVPEVMYPEAKAAGARVAGTGRSDAPNQTNNVTVFPGIFRGALDVRAKQINEEMKLAAAYAIAGLVPEKDLREDFVVVDAFDTRVAPAVAAAVAKAAIETDVARIKVDPEEVRARAYELIGRK